MQMTGGKKFSNVSTNKEFMDCLLAMVNPPKDDEGAGRMRSLKSYIIESDGAIPREFTTKRMCFEVSNTGLEKIKILKCTDDESKKTSEMFLDIHDKRFLILHTNELSETMSKITDEIISYSRHGFDCTWFHSMFLKQLTKKDGNIYKGFRTKYTDEYIDDDNGSIRDSRDLELSVSGSWLDELQNLIEGSHTIKNHIAYNRVRIMRGNNKSLESSIQDEIHYDGYFSVKGGRSVQNHLHLIDMAREDYAQIIKEIEDDRFGLVEINDRTLVEGKPFVFEFPTKIDDLESLLAILFNSRKPFRMWGIKTQIKEDYFRVMAVDLHTGSPMDFEIASDMIRVYLPKDSCGNTILRLLTNLQTHIISNITCPRVLQCAN